MTNEQIFDAVGLNADQIRALTTGAAPARPVIVRMPEEITRPICKVCGRPVGLKTCRAVRP
jgi:hypothetical protein